MNTEKEQGKPAATFERLGDSIYRRGTTIYARVRVNGKPTWKSTETNEPALARKWLAKWRNEDWTLKNGFELPSVALHRKRITVADLIEQYEEAGHPTKKMQHKPPLTIRSEKSFLSPIREYFGERIASSVSFADCDKYRDWRLSGAYVSEKSRTAGKSAVDCDLKTLSCVFGLAVRRGMLKANPLAGRSRYSTESEVRHCREVAPSPEGLEQIEAWLRGRNDHAIADLTCFLAFSGLRIGEALPMIWGAVNRDEQIIHVTREKRGITPWVPILPEMATLLKSMKTRATGNLLFPSPWDDKKPRDASAVRRQLKLACTKLEIGHVTPHGLRSYFVTRARESGLTDAEIAMLIGDRSGPAIIAHTYGDVRPEHLMAQAQRIRLTVGKSSIIIYTRCLRFRAIPVSS